MKNSTPVEICGEAKLSQEAGSEKRTFSVNAYNGGPLSVNGYEHPVVVDLRGLSQANVVVANLHHDKQKIVGHVTAVNVGKTSIELSGIVSGANDATREFIQASANGFPWQASIEYMPSELQELAAGTSEVVNGMGVDGPAYISRRGKLFGVAFVPRGADENTKVVVASPKEENPPKGELAMEPDLKQWLEASGIDIASVQPAQLPAFQKMFEASKAAKPEVEAEYFDASAINDMIQECRDGLADVFADAEGDILDRKAFSTIKANAKNELSELAKKARKEKWNTDRVRADAVEIRASAELAILRASAPSGIAIHASDRDTSPQVVEAAMAMSINRNAKYIKDEIKEKAHAAFPRGIGIAQVLLMAAAANGYRPMVGETLHAGNLRTVLQHACAVQASGFSTAGISVSNMLSNLATKEILEGYQESASEWQEIASKKSVKDFKEVTSYRMLDNMAYEEVGPTGELKHGTISQESYTRRAKTYGKMYSITREDLINDDMGAFNDMRARVGAGAAMKLNDVFWTKFLDNAAFFTAGRGNYITGGTTNLGADGVGLGLGVKAFRTMTTSTADGSKRIGGGPVLMLVPPELETIARGLYVSENLVGGGSTVTGRNIYQNLYRPVVVPWLSDSSFSGYSATAWYLVRDKNIWPTMVVSFLNGQESPTVESADANFNQLGIELRGYHDFGVDFAEYVGGLKSKGAA